MTTDSGLFGPSSVTWHLHADPAMWIGGISALHLQALHPLAALGIAQNSSFTADPRRRLTETGRFIVASTWGTTDQAQRAGARVRTVHAAMRIHDRDGDAVLCRLDEPDLLLWVHCTLVRSYLHATLRAGLPLRPGQADRYVGEQRRTAELVGLPAADAPGTVADLEDYLTGMRGLLAATPEARAIHGYLLDPPLRGPWRTARPAWAAASRLAFSLMPTWARALYGHQGWPEPLTTAVLRSTRRGALLIPWRRRLAFPEARLAQAVERLGPGSIPSGKRLSTPTEARTQT